MTSKSPQYNACSCSYYIKFPYLTLQSSFSNIGFQTHTYSHCKHQLTRSQYDCTSHIDTGSKDVNRKHAVAGLLQHAGSHWW